MYKILCCLMIIGCSIAEVDSQVLEEAKKAETPTKKDEKKPEQPAKTEKKEEKAKGTTGDPCHREPCVY